MPVKPEWVVVVEREDAGSIVVGFYEFDRALEWVRNYNLVTEKKWPHSFHNYARNPQRVVDHRFEFGRMLAEEGEDNGG